MALTRLVRLTVTAVAVGATLLTGTPAPAATPAGDVAGGATAPARHAAKVEVKTGARVKITKVLTFMVENHSLDQMQDSMPYVHQLATRYAYATDYTAVRHPSLPNYLAIASGSTQGVTDDADPSAHPLRGRTIFDQAIARGRSATVYVDAMTSNCQLTSSYPYAVKHNPWAYFVSSRANCRKHDVPLARLAHDVEAGTLPHAGMIVPDLVHDAHDADLGTSDAWIRTQVELIQSGADWQSGHLAIVITADEDDGDSDNRVLTVVASRYQDQRVVTKALSHYSLTRLYESVVGARYLGAAADARSMRRAFGIRTAAGG